MNVIIAGLGLIGGSFARAIKEKTGHHVAGLDVSGETLEKALAAGAIDEAVPGPLPRADLVLVALYPAAAIEFIRNRREEFSPGCVVVDLCGVKRAVCAKAEALLAGLDITFIGGHPMAGREEFGFDGALADLFEGASMILTPQNAPAKTLAWLEAFFLELGFAGVTLTTPAHHDEMIALTSQLAHVVSSAYVQNPVAQQYKGFSAGSFADMTRVAKLQEDMWTELFLLNADFLTQQTDVFIRKMTEFRNAIAAGDAAQLRAILRAGREMKEKLER